MDTVVGLVIPVLIGVCILWAALKLVWSGMEDKSEARERELARQSRLTRVWEADARRRGSLARAAAVVGEGATGSTLVRVEDGGSRVEMTSTGPGGSSRMVVVGNGNIVAAQSINDGGLSGTNVLIVNGTVISSTAGSSAGGQGPLHYSDPYRRPPKKAVSPPKTARPERPYWQKGPAQGSARGGRFSGDSSGENVSELEIFPGAKFSDPPSESGGGGAACEPSGGSGSDTGSGASE